MTLEGKYNSCIIYNDNIEQTALSQISDFLNSQAFTGAKIRIMPDCHAGSGCVIGFTSTLTDKVIPNIVGVDIGCGVLSYPLGIKDLDFESLDNNIRKYIPSGHNVHTSQSNGEWISQDFKNLSAMYNAVEKICTQQGQDMSRVISSLGSLGGGNHFIEIDRDQDGLFWVTLHSGSRNFGLKIANYWQSIAKIKTQNIEGMVKGLEYLEGDDYTGYLHDMVIAQRYAELNRHYMLIQILDTLGISYYLNQEIESVHNYIDLEYQIIRKGAISARLDENIVIPWNMRDGLIIGKGKGNSDWNQSAPHGAGRTMGRKEAKRRLNLSDFTETMKGIWTSCVSEDTIDESPMAYKNYKDIQDLIVDTVEVQNILKPVYNFKASE